MKLQFKHQKFQADAAKAVVDVFAGQPYLTPTYSDGPGLRRPPAHPGGDELYRLAQRAHRPGAQRPGGAGAL